MNMQRKIKYLERIEERKMNITMFHSWTESLWQFLLQMYVLVDETKAIQEHSQT